MGHEELASACRALGDPTRAHILQFLLGCCCTVGVTEDGAVTPMEGATAGEVCCHLTGEERVSSTVSFHLKELRVAGLIDVERSGKYMVCRPNRKTLSELAQFFHEASTCCVEGDCRG